MADPSKLLLGCSTAVIMNNLSMVVSGASDNQRSEAHNATETAVLSQVYQNAFYPNGDVDVNRDQ